MQESSYKMGAKGVKCGISLTTGEKDCVAVDFGISQINIKTINRYGFDQKKIMTDLTYSVDAAAKVLSDFKKSHKNEPNTWWTRYNCGSRSLDKIKNVCQQYQIKVARWM